MIQHATTAGNAWIQLRPQDLALLVVHTRTGVSSCADLGSKEGYVQEILRLLKAASLYPGPGSLTVELLSVGIDGFARTQQALPGCVASIQTWRIIYVVPTGFPEPETLFSTLSNGIRYGQFVLADIAAVVENPGIEGFASTKKLVQLLDYISGAKSRQVVGRPYTDWTGDRSRFRVCPNSVLDSGVDPELEPMSRRLR